MSRAERITEPHLVHGLTGLSSLSNDTSKSSSESAPQLQQVKLALLQPLANTEILEHCRDPNSRRPSNDEYLNIQPLSKSWRKELLKVPPIANLIFDLTLPKEGENNKTKVYWDTAMPQQDNSMGIHIRDISNLVITIATETRMRSNGGDVLFEVVYDDTEGVSRKWMGSLKKQLLALSTKKVPDEGAVS